MHYRSQLKNPVPTPSIVPERREAVAAGCPAEGDPVAEHLALGELRRRGRLGPLPVTGGVDESPRHAAPAQSGAGTHQELVGALRGQAGRPGEGRVLLTAPSDRSNITTACCQHLQQSVLYSLSQVT